MLLVQMQPPTAMEDEFHAWYDTEHVPEREVVPGFESAARFVCVTGWPRYMACYDLTSLNVLEEDPYRSIGGENLSVWSKRVIGRVVGYERLELALVDGAAAAQSQRGKALVRLAGGGRDDVVAAASRLGESAPAAGVRVFENQLPHGQMSIMFDAPALALIPEWSPAALGDALGELASSLLGVWRYTRYSRWT
jgi:hypothetical protein